MALVKQQTLTVLGRRNKQQILKDFIRPPAANSISSTPPTIGEGYGGGGNCGGKGGPSPGTFSEEPCPGRAIDWPDWDWDDFEGTNMVPAPADGNFSGTFLSWPALPLVTSGQFGDEQDGQLDVQVDCPGADLIAIAGTFNFTPGQVESEAPVYSPETFAGTPLKPTYFANAGPGTALSNNLSDPGISYGSNGLDNNKGTTFYPREDYSTKSWIGPTSTLPDYQRGHLAYFESDVTGPYEYKVNAMMDEWLWIESSNVSGQPVEHRAWRTGMVNPNSFSFFVYHNESTDQSWLQLGNIRVYPMGSAMIPIFGWVISRNGGSLDNASLIVDLRRGARESYGPMTASLSFFMYAWNHEVDEESPQTEVALMRLPDGTYESPIDVGSFDEVSFDGIEAIEGTHYSVNGNAIIPVESLPEDTIVTALVTKANASP